MMHDRIGRTIKTTHVNGFYYDDNGKRDNFELELNGNYTDYNRILKQVCGILNLDRVILENYTVESAYYSMPIETFMEYATCSSEK